MEARADPASDAVPIDEQARRATARRHRSLDDLVRVQEIRTFHDRLRERDHHERRIRAPRLVHREGRVRRIGAEIVRPSFQVFR